MDQSWTEFLTGGPQCLPMCDRGRGANDAGADGWPPGIHMLLWCHIENKPKFHRSVSRRWCKSDSSITKRKCSFSSSTQLLLFKRDIGSCYSPQHPRRHWGNECQNAGKLNRSWFFIIYEWQFQFKVGRIKEVNGLQVVAGRSLPMPWSSCLHCREKWLAKMMSWLVSESLLHFLSSTTFALHLVSLFFNDFTQFFFLHKLFFTRATAERII